MANKKQTKKAHRKAVRATRGTEKANRKAAKHHDDGIGKLVDSIQKRSELEGANQAAARIAKEPTDN